MTIYLAFSGSGGSDDIFLAAFSTLELAKDYADKEGYHTFVTEYELDAPEDNSEIVYRAGLSPERSA